jgi:hypothetical protein
MPKGMPNGTCPFLAFGPFLAFSKKVKKVVISSECFGKYLIT